MDLSSILRRLVAAAPPSLLLLATATSLVGQFPSRRSQANAKPPRMVWQRTLTDALELVRTRKVPLLIAVNRDGEVFNDTLADNQYRDVAFATLASRYVAVIASPDRHNPRDHDDAGRRILCPRFGCVTCGEHIALEPILFEKYFKNNRVAPRHLGIGVDGKELFDRYLDRSLTAVDQALRKHANQSGPPPNLDSADRNLPTLLKSCSGRDRTEVESRFDQADAAGRVRILELAAKSGREQPTLARMGLMRGDRETLAGAISLLNAAAEPPLLLILNFLGRAPGDADYQAILPALVKAATSDPTARRALTIRKALTARCTAVDPVAWQKKLALEDGPLPDDISDEHIAAIDEGLDAKRKRAKQTKDGALYLSVAEDNFLFALHRLGNRKDPTFLLLDAESAIDSALENGVKKAIAAPLRARVLWMLNKREEAGKQAVLALTEAGSPLHQRGSTATALQVLEIYARTQQDRLNRPITKESDYPSQAVTNAHAAYTAISYHPLATAEQVQAHVDFLLFLGVRRDAGIALRRSIRRFSAWTNLQQQFRDQVAWERGLSGLETAYDALQAEGRDAATDYFAGFAILIAADVHAANTDLAAARRAYQKAMASLERSGITNPAYRDSAQHYVALCYSGLARLALDQGEIPEALRLGLAGAAARPASFGTLNGQGNSLQRTLRRVRRRLEEAQRVELDGRLKELGLSLTAKDG